MEFSSDFALSQRIMVVQRAKKSTFNLFILETILELFRDEFAISSTWHSFEQYSWSG